MTKRAQLALAFRKPLDPVAWACEAEELLASSTPFDCPAGIKSSLSFAETLGRLREWLGNAEPLIPPELARNVGYWLEHSKLLGEVN